MSTLFWYGAAQKQLHTKGNMPFLITFIILFFKKTFYSLHSIVFLLYIVPLVNPLYF